MNQNKNRRWVYYILLACWVSILMFRLIPLGYYQDDVCDLCSVKDNTVWDFMFSSGAINSLSPACFTPLKGISLRIDWLLSNTDPISYSLHNAFCLWMFSILLFALIYRQTGMGIASLLCSMAIISSPPVITTAASYAMRHYLGGLCLGFAAFLLFYKHMTDKRLVWLILSAVAALASMLMKEMFILLVIPAVLLAYPDRQAVRKAVFIFGSMSLVYLSLRWMYNLHCAEFPTPPQEIVVYSLRAILAGIYHGWPRLCDTVLWGGGKPYGHIIPFIIVHVFIFFTGYWWWRSYRLLGVAGLILLLASSIAIVSFVLCSPIYHFAQRANHCMEDRFIVLFAVTVLFVFLEGVIKNLLCHPRLGIRRLGWGILILTVIITFIGGQKSVRTWRKHRLSRAAWLNIRHLMRNEKAVFFGEAQTVGDISIFWHVVYQDKFIEKSVKAPFNPARCYLVIPRAMPIPARSIEEVYQWDKKYNSWSAERGFNFKRPGEINTMFAIGRKARK